MKRIRTPGLFIQRKQAKSVRSAKNQLHNVNAKKKTKNNNPNPGDGKIRVQRLTKGRKGKGISAISGIPLEDTELKALAKKLKIKCGTGGTIKNGIIEIQGDHRDVLIEELKKLGYKAIKSGG